MSDIDLIIQARVDGIKQVTSLSASLKQLNTSVKGVFVPMSKLDAQTRALNKALGMGSRGAKEHATSLKGLVANQKVLSEETKRVTKDIRAMQSLMAKGQRTNLINPQNLEALKQMRTTMNGMRFRAFSSDVQNIGLRLKKLGKDAQFVGRSLMINLTAPFVLFSRFGLQSLVDYDKQAVRLTKVLDSVAMSAEQAMAKTGIPDENNAKVIELQENFRLLDDQLSATSQKFGLARSLTTGLAADFAELGISGKENIAAITRLTAATEKLGGMDITASQELIQAMYFQSVRAFESAGRSFENAAAREKAAISSSIANLQMFNAIENATALTLRDIGTAFPEVASMATTFGLSMIEAAAMLAPMKAAGLNVGASANAIKVSLQRLVAPTKQNQVLMDRLGKQYANTAEGSRAFEDATKSGLQGLLGLVDVFTAVRRETGGLEGPMELMSEIFGVRQGPRMQIAIQQLSEFNEKLKGVGSSAGSVEKQLADIATAAANNTKLSVTDLTKIGVIARVATAQVGQEVETFGKVTAKDIQDARNARKAVGEEML
jgi:TP901 family phage tail tape measure protein